MRSMDVPRTKTHVGDDNGGGRGGRMGGGAEACQAVSYMKECQHKLRPFTKLHLMILQFVGR